MLRTVADAVIVALGMFSRIPMPARELEGPAMRYAIAAWPLVGVAQGLASAAFWLVASLLGLPPLVTGAGLALMPIAVNGGIHADGLADTVDALSSHAGRERRLQIMADPQVGSFAVLAIAGHLVAAFALCASCPWSWRSVAALGLTYVLSRAVAGWTVVEWPSAHEGGLAWAFSQKARGAATPWLVLAMAIACGLGLVLLQQMTGLVVVGVCALTLAWYHHMAMSAFGGVTGDTSGWFVQTGELAMLAALAVGGVLA